MIPDHLKTDGYKTLADASDEARRLFYRALGIAAVASALDLDIGAESASLSGAYHNPAFLVNEDLAA
ncbi:MAG: hypothetical protein JWN93_1036 [Hyphomicrobiales bacterium]|jgi:hypothetical protein|nr:hypothetical protein [Hyphomicrobiales bacterium]